MICPKFASCITPCVYGRRDYYFLTKVCLADQHMSCLHFIGGTPEKPWDEYIATLEKENKGWGNTKKCDRLEVCLAKDWTKAPVDEYVALVCKQEVYSRCLYYFVWILNGRDPDSGMDTLELDEEYNDYMAALPGRVINRLAGR